MSRLSSGKAGITGIKGVIVSINISQKKGVVKTPVEEAVLIRNQGIDGDAHQNFGSRQVSLLMVESIEKMERELSPQGNLKLPPGSFAENITTQGLDLSTVKTGDELIINGQVRLRISQIGKECHTGCAISKITGECIMPTEGIFCEVIDGGKIRKGHSIEKA